MGCVYVVHRDFFLLGSCLPEEKPKNVYMCCAMCVLVLL